MSRIWSLILLVLLSAVVPAQGETPERTPDPSAQEKPEGPEKSDPKDAAHQRDERLAHSLFPTTAELLDHLRKHDPEAHARVLAAAEAHVARQEAAALAFAEEHHPEYHALLLDLRNRKRQQAWQAALRELVVDHRRIEAEESARAREDAIEEWQAASRLKLLVAQLARAKVTEITDELDALVRQQERLRRRRMQRQAQALSRRLQVLHGRLAEDLEHRVRLVLQNIRKRLEKSRAPEPKKDGSD